jgi:EAL domain-containing protein (putative c-di-GMP-specific phosphodiesterase class I)
VNRVPTRIVTEPELQRALDCGELVPLYQPVIDLRTGAAVEVEALLRWDHRDRGLLAPGEFLVDEDDSSLLVRIGWSVVIEAARRADAWRRAFPARPITVSVNLFDDHLERRELADRIEHLARDHEEDATRLLAFEVGEHHVHERRRRTRDRLTVLQNVGVDVVVDDFGASTVTTDLDADTLRDQAVDVLATMRSFPVDRVKLDPRFVQRLEGSDRLGTVVDAAHASELTVVALAIEDATMAAIARDAGCDLAQGFHFARPEPPERIEALLAST